MAPTTPPNSPNHGDHLASQSTAHVNATPRPRRARRARGPPRPWVTAPPGLQPRECPSRRFLSRPRSAFAAAAALTPTPTNPFSFTRLHTSRRTLKVEHPLRPSAAALPSATLQPQTPQSRTASRKPPPTHARAHAIIQMDAVMGSDVENAIVAGRNAARVVTNALVLRGK